MALWRNRLALVKTEATYGTSSSPAATDALLFTEMVNATSLELGHGRQKVEELAMEAGPIGVQLFDHRPAAMAEAARRAEAA